jgi:two-component system sensor histidine kinase KdpD
MMLAIGIIVAAVGGGLLASISAALVTSLGYTLFLTDPYFSLILHPGDMLAIAAFALCALIVGGLSGRLQEQVRVTKTTNVELMSLLVVSQELQAALGTRDVLERLRRIVHHRLGVEAHVYLHRDGELREASDGFGPAPSAAGNDLVMDLWRRGMSHRHQGDLTALALKGVSEPLGVLLIDAGTKTQAIMEPALASGLANLLCLAIERSGLGESEAEVQAQRRAEELKTALLSSISHDFRTPLTTITASATSLLKFDDTLPVNTRRRLLGSIVEEGDRLNRYTANLLELSKLQAGAPIQTAEVVDVVDIVGAVLQRLPSRLGGRTLRHSLPPEPVLVRTDPALLELVLLNVLDNAVIYSPDDTTIEISVRADDAMAEIDIRDEGCGIPAADLDKVFERFHRIKRPEPRPRGSGLGLPIAKAFVEAFGGRIWVETPGLNGRGTRVAVRLPLSKVAA